MITNNRSSDASLSEIDINTLTIALTEGIGILVSSPLALIVISLNPSLQVSHLNWPAWNQ